MITHVLDTSALLAHFRNEAGADAVQSVFENEDTSLGISAVSLAEFGIRLATLGMSQAEIQGVIDEYRKLLDAIVPLTDVIAVTALRLKTTASARLPLVDALIAATAVSEKAVLVHRDAHFLALSERALKQKHIAAIA